MQWVIMTESGLASNVNGVKKKKQTHQSVKGTTFNRPFNRFNIYHNTSTIQINDALDAFCQIRNIPTRRFNNNDCNVLYRSLYECSNYFRKYILLQFMQLEPNGFLERTPSDSNPTVFHSHQKNYILFYSKSFEMIAKNVRFFTVEIGKQYAMTNGRQ